MRRFQVGLVIASAAVSAPKNVAADPRPAQAVPVLAPPIGRVGRVAVVSGKVELQSASVASWSDAETNDPVATGSAIRTGAAARALVEVGADSIALAAASKVMIALLDARNTAIDLAKGRMGLALRERNAADVEVTVPQGEAWLREPGSYDIDVGGTDGQERITTFAGQARVYVGGGVVSLGPNETTSLAAGAPAAATIMPAKADAFAAWWREQTNETSALTLPFFVSPDLTGFAALAGAGHWVRTGSYGEVWLPYAPPAVWAPYRNGHWRWFGPWGWTWIDNQPWGFAPSHYGRWTRLGQSWAWVPGNLASYPIYLPAAVAFLGTPGIGLSYAGGSGPAIGWFSLAPGEAYWPSYTQNLSYIRTLNGGDVGDLDSIRPQPDGRLPVEVVDRPFANRLSASVVPRPIFVGGLPVANALLDLPEERLRDMPVVMGSPRIGPPASPSPKPPVVLTARAMHPALETAAKRAAWLKTVHLAAVRSRLYVQAARLHHFVVLHLRAPVFAESARLRRLAALRLLQHRASHKNEAAR
jgi:Family of unknown function (DUF6600)